MGGWVLRPGMGTPPGWAARWDGRSAGTRAPPGDGRPNWTFCRIRASIAQGSAGELNKTVNSRLDPPAVPPPCPPAVPSAYPLPVKKHRNASQRYGGRGTSNTAPRHKGTGMGVPGHRNASQRAGVGGTGRLECCFRPAVLRASFGRRGRISAGAVAFRPATSDGP